MDFNRILPLKFLPAGQLGCFLPLDKVGVSVPMKSPQMIEIGALEWSRKHEAWSRFSRVGTRCEKNYGAHDAKAGSIIIRQRGAKVVQLENPNSYRAHKRFFRLQQEQPRNATKEEATLALHPQP